jgi:hypothetical protein
LLKAGIELGEKSDAAPAASSISALTTNNHHILRDLFRSGVFVGVEPLRYASCCRQ